MVNLTMNGTALRRKPPGFHCEGHKLTGFEVYVKCTGRYET